ncbi:MAG: hypothetical protein KF900_00695 [Bacteroidetes bacterium]|nr:hypothetical protein [Bacteroidota bacterium]
MLALFYGMSVYPQSSFFKKKTVDWNKFDSIEIPHDFEKYKNSDIVFIDDKTDFRFIYGGNQGVRSELGFNKITRLITLRINTEKGLQELSNFKLPESFDMAFTSYFVKQGRQSRIKTPFIIDDKIEQFSARKYVAGEWQQMQFKDRYEQVKWTKHDGEFLNDEITVLQLQNLKVGDVVQIYYNASFRGSYYSNLFYFYSKYPKLNVNYSFTYNVDKQLAHLNYLLPVNIKDSCFSRTKTEKEDKIIVTDKFVFKNMNGINYPANSFEGERLPHVFLDFNFIYYFIPYNRGGFISPFLYDKPKDFEWVVSADTTIYRPFYGKSNANYWLALRKYISKFPPLHNNSDNTTFFKAFFDDINSFRYITRNQLVYNESHLINATTAEHINKRRWVSFGNWFLRDIFYDNNIFYYLVNIQDGRYGNHNPFYRAHYFYEWELLAVPNKNSYTYFMSRPGGVSYHPNELPFYLEGSVASLLPMNFQETDTIKSAKFFKFIKTHKGTFNENTRTENASVKISLDERKAEYNGKESLSGQFSTTLRHLYLNEIIDSTIAPYYFKRCTDKPFTSEAKINLSSKITDYPFRYTFNCSENISLPETNTLNMTHWFSFLFSSKILPEIPTHDYFFDFDFTDVYNFVLEFDKPVQLKNATGFTRNISNNYFELSSRIVQNSETSYLIKVNLQLKQMLIPLADMQLLMDLVKELDAINNFSLEW